MQRYLARRLIAGILTLVAATFVVFSLSRMFGDPLLLYATPGGYGNTPEQQAALAAKLGLDKPFIVQYFMWLGNAARGDLGETLLAEQPVSAVIADKVGASVQLGLAAWVFATFLGVPLGVLSAVKRGSVWDYFGRTVALFGQALPVFWIGIMGILIFAVTLDWLPVGSRGTDKDFWGQLQHFVLPTITLGWLPAAAYLRLTRSAMLEVMDSEFIKLARAKGVSHWKVIWKHAFRNALIPPLTVSALVLAGFLEGSVIVEVVFSWPGLGRLTLRALQNNDFPVLTAAILLFTTLYVVMNFLADMTYAYIDPRIKYS
ncbi:MAG: ABC transporter permease [Chloroflexota bacterium]